MIFVVLIIAGMGFGVAKMIRYFKKQQRKGLLDPPIDLLEGRSTERVLPLGAFYFSSISQISKNRMKTLTKMAC